MSASVYRQQLEAYLKTLDIKADRVIDVGGGSNPVSKRVKSWDVRDYQVIDNELERQQTKITFKFDMNNRLLNEDASQFDIVFCLELFDYIWDPVQACKNLRKLCADKGKLIVTFPFVYPNHNPVAYDMLRYTKQGVAKLLNEAGFWIDKTIPRRIANTGQWKEWLDSEGYRSRGAQEAGTLFDAGYIIEAHPKL